MDFIETTALRQRRNEGREVTVTSRLHRQKDKKRQRKTEERGDRRPAVAPGAGVRWRGSSTGAPGAGLRITVAKDLRVSDDVSQIEDFAGTQLAGRERVRKKGGGMALASTSQVGENSACGYAHTRD